MYQMCGMNAAPDNRLYHISHGDRLLAGIILVFAIGAVLVTARYSPQGHTTALVHLGVAPVQTLDLSVDQFVTNGIAGQPVQFEIARGHMRIQKIACPRKLCMHTGWISRPGEMIVCAPNAILIEVVESSDLSEYDAVSH
jgi:hypothetical protein